MMGSAAVAEPTARTEPLNVTSIDEVTKKMTGRCCLLRILAEIVTRNTNKIGGRAGTPLGPVTKFPRSVTIRPRDDTSRCSLTRAGDYPRCCQVPSNGIERKGWIALNCCLVGAVRD